MVYQRISKPSSENSQIHQRDSASTVHKMPVQAKSDSASPQEQEMPSYTPLPTDWATNNNLMNNLSGTQTQKQSVETGIIQRKSLKEKLKEHSNQVEEIIKRFKDGKTKVSKLRDAVANIANKEPQIVQTIAQNNDGKDALKAMLKSMSSSTTKEAEKFGCLAIQAVFGIEKVEGFGGTALARLCSVLEKIHAKHINSTDNTSLKSLLRDKSSWLSRRGVASSTYESSTATIAYGKATLGHTHGGLDKVLRPLGAPFMSSPQSNLARQNLFDQTVLHEIGHAIDEKFNIMGKYGKESLFGGWQEHQSSPEKAITIASQGIPLSGTYNEKTVNECLRAVVAGQQVKEIIGPKVDSHNSSVKSLIKTDPTTSIKILNKKEQINRYSAHPAIKAARIGGDKLTLQGAKGAWQMSDNALAEVALNGRVFHKAYGGTGDASRAQDTWVSYELDARKHKVSMYQWRAPSEWFAEIYSHYFLKVLPTDHPVYDWIKEFIDQNDHLDPGKIKNPTEWEKQKREAEESIKSEEEAEESIKSEEKAEESIKGEEKAENIVELLDKE